MQAVAEYLSSHAWLPAPVAVTGISLIELLIDVELRGGHTPNSLEVAQFSPLSI